MSWRWVKRPAQTGPQGTDLTGQVLLGLREALASAISDIFVIGLAVIVVALAVTLLLKEVPLKSRHSQDESVSTAEPGDGDG